MIKKFSNKLYDIIKDKGINGLVIEAINHNWELKNRLFVELQEAKLEIKYGSAAPSTYDLIYINPNNVKNFRYMSEVVKNRIPIDVDYKCGTYVIGGGWDTPPTNDDFSDAHDKIPFEDYCLWKAIVEHYEDNIEWENITICREVDKPLSYFKKTEEIYNSIDKNGYLLQEELDVSKLSLLPPEHHEIRINIGRNGELIFEDGVHRFCVVKKLGIKKIPVRVYVRHENWQKIRENIYRDGFSDKYNEDLRYHPDLINIIDST